MENEFYTFLLENDFKLDKINTILIFDDNNNLI